MRRERLKHALWASLLSLIMAVTLFLEPIDWILWTNQSRLRPVLPSNDIVYLQVDGTISAPDYPAERIKLAGVLDRLREAGARRVFIDAVLEKSTSAAADDRLNRSLARWGPQLAFVDRIDEGRDGGEERTDAFFADGHGRVVQGTNDAWPNIVWTMPYVYRTASGARPSFAAALGEKSGTAAQTFLVDYSLPGSLIPKADLKTLSQDGDGRAGQWAGKTFVLGVARTAISAEYRVPTDLTAPPSYVAIHAAETLKRGPIVFISGIVVVLALAAFLLSCAAVNDPRHRRLAYLAAIGLPVYLFLVSALAALRIELSYALPMLALYGLLRSRSNWKRRVAHIDPDTGLPSFRALSQHLGQLESGEGYAVIAKVHGYETILKSLEGPHRGSYMMKLVERIRVGDPRMTVYVDGHYLAWRVALPNEARLREHLEGLRAIFAAPVTVDARSIDVGITFGAAVIDSGQAQRSIAAALAAVEETSEALEPIMLADDSTDADTLWDLSVRARIDAAMEAGEVFCVYQPKIDIAEDRLIGVEALVRWEDPERGFIPPLHFVMQCEKAGRMEYLTRYVLQSACSAGKLIHFRGSLITMSVNISATLLADMRIVGIVRNVLQATGFDPNYLTLEITETARIRDLAQARVVLKALKALGAHLSMDDFGVGAANFETLQALPFDEIKIDRQFVSRAASSVKARAITASIVGLGATARIAVVAEGAETESDLRILREIGCWQVQGYALARPMPLTNLLQYLESGPEGTQTATV
ncbi:MAG: EAL domain-containing protein [Altererythrobacter sp.]|nr:EAL domain-containing protein [Altererythrobacter sp.]